MTELFSFLDTHNGAISAVAAVVIACLTVALVIVSRTQARLTREALVTTERAFVFLEDLNPDWTYHCDDTPRLGRLIIRPLWKNNGTTPTKNMSVAVNCTLWMGPNLPSDFSYAYGNEQTRMFLAPQATEWSAPIEVHPTMATDALNGRSHLFVWGRVDYQDIFDRTPHRFTQWCYRVILKADRDGFLPPQFVAYGNYNRSDEDSR